MSQPNVRRMIRAQRLTQELGFEDSNQALEAAIEWRNALRVIHTWAGVPGALDARHVRSLCDKALKQEQQ